MIEFSFIKNLSIFLIVVLLCITVIPFLISFYIITAVILIFFSFANLLLQLFFELFKKKEKDD